MQSENYELGMTAAQNDRPAADCPFPTGIKRKEWLAGFFSVKPAKPSRVKKADCPTGCTSGT
jgi:hypothetical protein